MTKPDEWERTTDGFRWYWCCSKCGVVRTERKPKCDKCGASLKVRRTKK